MFVKLQNCKVNQAATEENTLVLIFKIRFWPAALDSPADAEQSLYHILLWWRRILFFANLTIKTAATDI